ncbi:MAG: hypothetical protein RMY16_30255 [Nostoc sp. DedQUE12b]|uniref:hypothetical protein n=1 Tax=Nostoc sp. DedQUE12b TaxID=3075398 RepID=UPI002AD3B954|nr:hypothetical protein [Nostoc sp. DedQUE12b]MDZ8089801.1 hypothetical protein [Nostoc sp. DedQUE12b]
MNKSITDSYFFEELSDADSALIVGGQSSVVAPVQISGFLFIPQPSFLETPIPSPSIETTVPLPGVTVEMLQELVSTEPTPIPM